MKKPTKVFVFVLFTCILAKVRTQTDDPALLDAGPLGIIQGTQTSSYEENGVRKPYVQFRGIPYATITRRFMPSTLLEEDLDGPEIFDARPVREYCYQPYNPAQYLAEDCLFLNIYTPAKYTGDDSLLKPVIFYIHGGDFVTGYGAFFGGGRLLARDVVLVTFNYRLGLLGFFTLENEDVPGNAGMYDVVNALTWTNKYIKYFGGDPSKVIIAGQESGSVTVAALLSSPLAQGLFHGAIGASGSSLNNWATTTNPLQDSLNLASYAGCHNASNPNPELALIAECMRSANPMVLVDALSAYQKSERKKGRLGFNLVSPVVQSWTTSIPKFLDKHPRETFQAGQQSDIPLLMSCTKHDGSYILGVFYNHYIKANGLENNTEFMRYELVPTLLNSLGIPDIPSGIHESIAQLYLGDSSFSGDFTEMWPGLLDIVSVFFFKGDSYETALLHSKVNSTYWMSFEFKGRSSFWGQLFPAPDVPPPFPGGITHTDDMIYLFPLTFLLVDDEEAAVSTKMMDIWVNFATNGAPSTEHEWPALNSTTEHYLSMDGPFPASSTFYRKSFAGPGYDVNPTSPPTTTEASTTTPQPDQSFNCSHRLDGFYPHTEECTHYFGCLGGQSIEFVCPNPLLYDPELRGCHFTSQTDCGLNCEGKGEGLHPHPFYCHLYIGCWLGQRYILECAYPLLFDPDTGNCNFPTMVDCLADY